MVPVKVFQTSSKRNTLNHRDIAAYELTLPFIIILLGLGLTLAVAFPAFLR